MGAPQLLPKRIVNAEVATQKAQQIKEGMVLAKKVDALRETKNEEEARLEEFRRMAVSQIQGEINGKILESERLDAEIRLKQAKSAAISPSVQEQWQQIKEERTSIENERSRIEEDRKQLQLSISLNIQREKDNKEEEQRIADEKKRSDEFLQKADKIKDDAVKELQTARSQAQEILKKAIQREKAVSIREGNIAERERQVAIETQTNVDWEIDLSGRERAIKDRYETLERTIKRLNK